MRWLLLMGLLLSGYAVIAQPPIRGFDFAAWGPGIYNTANSDASLKNLAATGANWVGIVVTAFQSHPNTTDIARSPAETPTDADLRHAIATAHRLRMKVMLKPHVDLPDGEGHWRGDIGTGFSDAQWTAWFTIYTKMLVYYATLARRNSVDMLCVGTELEGTSDREAEWRAVIAAVRAVYKGPLVYAGNWDGEAARIRFWDALDYIGVDAYYPLSEQCGASVDALKQGWAVGLKEMTDLHEKWQKKVLLTEAGFRSVYGACREPWEWQTSPTLDLLEQANGYQATFETLWAQPWLAGIFWWDWEADLSVGGPNDRGYTPWEKPAAAIVKQYYQGK